MTNVECHPGTLLTKAGTSWRILYSSDSLSTKADITSASP